MKILDLLISKNIRVSTIGGIGIKLSSTLFAFINGVLLANLLSLEDFGVYSLVFVTANVAVTLSSFGLPNMLTYFSSIYYENLEFGNLKGLFFFSLRVFLLTSFFLLLLASIVFYFFDIRLNDNEGITYLYGILLTPLLVIGSIRASFLRGMKHIILAELPDTFLRNFIFFLTLLAIFWTEMSLSSGYAMLLHLIAAFISFFIGMIILIIKLGRKLMRVKSTNHSRLWLNKMLPFGYSSILQVLKQKSINYFIAIFLGYESVALYEVASRGANLVSFTLAAINSAINPYIASAFFRKKMKNVQRIVSRANQLSVIFSFPIFLTFVIGGVGLLTTIFGEEYSLAYWPLVVLSFGHLVNAVAGAAGPVLGMTGNQKILTNILFYMFLLNVFIGIPLIIYFDVLGATISFTFIIVLQNILLVYYIKKKLGLYTSLI